MSTHIYKPSNSGSKTALAKLEDGKIYDLSNTTSSKSHIADAVDDKVYVRNLSKQKLPHLLVKEDVIYHQTNAFDETPICIATDGAIYDFSNYTKGSVVAEYTGNPIEAMQCYAALIIFSNYDKKKNKAYTEPVVAPKPEVIPKSETATKTEATPQAKLNPNLKPTANRTSASPPNYYAPSARKSSFNDYDNNSNGCLIAIAVVILFCLFVIYIISGTNSYTGLPYQYVPR